ncbi:MAG: amidohydrolase family protein, partial [Planctomycetota bacterium]
FDSLSSDYQERVSGIKLFTDGAIGSGTAAISRSYKSSFSGPENFGMLIYEDDELENAIQTSLQKKAALAIHAIGDRAIEQVICGLEKTGKSKLHQKCVRIEHAQLIHPDQARRVKDLGVTLSMQPNFSSDSAAYSDRLDSGFCQSNNPFRMLIDEIGFIPGQDLIFGSDGMPHGAEEALNQSFFPPLENQRIQLDEFVAGYCTDLSRGQIEFEVDESLRKIRIKQIKASF